MYFGTFPSGDPMTKAFFRALPASGAALLLLAGAAAQDNSAIEQLQKAAGKRLSDVQVPTPTAACAYCGRRIGTGHAPGCPQGPKTQKPSAPGVPVAPALNPSQQMALTLVGGLFNSLFSGMFDEEERGAAAAAAAEAERARLEAEARAAWEAAERRRLAALVSAQRQRRDAENEASLEGLRAALGEGFDTPPKDPLEAALSDPAVVDLRGKQGVVQPIPPPPPPVARAEVEKAARRAAERRARYEKMVQENADARILADRLAELEKRQEEVREQLIELKRGAKRSVRLYEAAEEDVREAASAAMERGLSLSVDALMAGKDKVLEHLKKVQSNSELWKETLQSVEGVDRIAGWIDQANEDIDWLRAKRELLKDLEYLGERVGILGTHWKLGKSIVLSGMEVRQELQALRTIREQDGLNEAYRARLEDLTAQNRKLVEELRRAREELARKLGVPVDQIPRPDHEPKPPTRLGFPVPHPDD